MTAVENEFGMSIQQMLELNDKISVVRSVYLFSALSDAQLEVVIQHMKVVKYMPGEYIIKEGEEGQTFYIIEDGEVQISKDGNKIRKIGSLEYFGERALVFDEPRSASVQAVKPTHVMELSKQHFCEIISSAEN